MSKSKKQLKHKIKMMRADYVELDRSWDRLHQDFSRLYSKHNKVMALIQDALTLDEDFNE